MLRLMGDDEGEGNGNRVADVALSALSLPWGNVSELIPQAPSMPSKMLSHSPW